MHRRSGRDARPLRRRDGAPRRIAPPAPEDRMRDLSGLRGLTLTQPWASAIALGYKRVETRSFRVSYRGPIAIHAAKRFPRAARALRRTSMQLDAYRGFCHAAASSRLRPSPLVEGQRTLFLSSTHSSVCMVTTRRVGGRGCSPASSRSVIRFRAEARLDSGVLGRRLSLVSRASWQYWRRSRSNLGVARCGPTLSRLTIAFADAL